MWSITLSIPTTLLPEKRQGEDFREIRDDDGRPVARAFQWFEAPIRGKGQELPEVLDDWLGQKKQRAGMSCPRRSDQDGRWNFPFH